MRPVSLLLLLFFFGAFSGFTQELPPVLEFDPIDYQAGNQNWKIDQGADGKIFVANNDGLLVYNGAYWNHYPTPNKSIMRSVKVIDDLVYTGCYMDIGFWSADHTNTLKYQSLAEEYSLEFIEDEQFWDIQKSDHYVLFQSLNRILIFDTLRKTFSSVGARNGVTKMFLVGDDIYFHSFGLGIFKVLNGEATPFLTNQNIANSRIVSILQQDDELLILSEQNGFYRYNTRDKLLEEVPLDDRIKSLRIYSVSQLSEGNIALGTIATGVLIINEDLEILYRLDQYSGLSNNTVLSLKEDRDHNIWLALDSGINCINLNSPFRIFRDNGGELGTVYTTAIKDDILYLGTNQGLFYREGNDKDFRLIEGTKSQVWSLFIHDDQVFCGHDSGTFLIKGGEAELLANIPGTWDFRVIPGEDSKLLQGNYNGFNLLEKRNGKWQYAGPVEGFNYSSKHFEITDDLKIFMSHEYKGVFELQLDKSLKLISDFKKLELPEKGKNAGLTRFNRDIIYANQKGIYRLDLQEQKGFTRDTLLSELFQNDKYVSGKMINDRNGNLWVFTKDNLNRISTNDLGSYYTIEKTGIPYEKIRSKSGYEHISYLGGEKYLIASKDGYLKMDLSEANTRSYQVQLERAFIHSFNQKDSLLNHKVSARLSSDNNNIGFKYYIPEYREFTEATYRYRLMGHQDAWTDWTKDPIASFENLSYGEYRFEVEGRIGNRKSENIASFSFVILRPWYLSNWALTVYFILLVISAYFINRQYKRYYTRQQYRLIKENEEKMRLQQLQNEQEIIRLRNEKLREDVESKNRELAASTMNLIKKNEFLIEVRDRLKKLNGKSEKDLKTIISSINNDISEEDNWNLFKDAFNNADKDFLKKVKEKHPTLTPNDLRLCAYLRLNLSSKEIAPLLNISVRSVEIKRYRLRKKMDLEHEQSLVEYILDI
ncbi:triple tyrosine motif-containing protein [Robertkochia aurantiaca]|uniref:triple tyrosine motif-containing protein n=1 Tax=Robertkochia aurantiaca TaxID=2873700 RepID=UPI001CCC97BC|nr:triple tyrosine motif-containing protein [Robertkochia sp. 3YJGBD-33]